MRKRAAAARCYAGPAVAVASAIWLCFDSAGAAAGWDPSTIKDQFRQAMVFVETELEYDAEMRSNPPAEGCSLKTEQRVWTCLVYGSGFIVSEGGYLLSSSHVVPPPAGDVNKVTPFGRVGGPDEPRRRLAVIERASAQDAVLMKVAGEGLKWSPVYIAEDPRRVKEGYLMALGFAGGGSLAVTDGRLVRTDDDAQGALDTTLDVVPGFSGGPVFNNEGVVVGMVRSGIPTSPVERHIVPMNHLDRMLQIPRPPVRFEKDLSELRRMLLRSVLRL